MSFEVGQFVLLSGSGVGIVTHLPDDLEVPEEHIGVWFGTLNPDGNPIVCTIPAEYLTSGPLPSFQH